MWQNLSIQPNDSIFIELEFEKTPGDTVDNIAEISACNNDECKDSFVNVFSSVGGYVPEQEYVVTEDLDLHLQKYNGNCTGIDAIGIPT